MDNLLVNKLVNFLAEKATYFSSSNAINERFLKTTDWQWFWRFWCRRRGTLSGGHLDSYVKYDKGTNYDQG